MTLYELITQTPSLDTISPAVIAHWAVLYTVGNNEADVMAAIARERCRRALVAAAANVCTPSIGAQVTLFPVAPVTAESVMRWRTKQVAQTAKAAKVSSPGRRSPQR